SSLVGGSSHGSATSRNPLSRKPCFPIGEQRNWTSGALIVRPKPPFARDRRTFNHDGTAPNKRGRRPSRAVLLTPAQKHILLLHVADAIFGHAKLLQDLLIVLALIGRRSRGGQFRTTEDPWIARHAQRAAAAVVDVNDGLPLLDAVRLCEFVDRAHAA